MARLSSTRLLGIAPLIAGLTMLVPLYAFVSGHTGTPGIRHLTLQPIYCLTMFAVGIAAGVLYLRHRDSDWGRMVLLPSATAVLALLTLNRVDESPFYIPCLILSFAGLVYGLAFGQGTVARLLSRGRIVLLGEASYGMYILQDPIDAVYQTVVKHMVSVPPAHVLESWPAVLLYVLLLVLCSVVSLRVIETPARLRLKAALSDWRSAKGSRPSDAAVSVPSFPG